MRMLARIPAWTGLALLIAGVAFGGIAWQMQGAAAGDLAEAIEVQQDEPPDDSAPPPKISQYKMILDTLDESLRIRKQIDDSLGEIEEAVAALSREQSKAKEISTRGGAEITRIAETLGAAAGAARVTATELRTLRQRLDVSADFSRAIAEELEELDRSLGPTIPDDILDILPVKP